MMRKCFVIGLLSLIVLPAIADVVVEEVVYEFENLFVGSNFGADQGIDGRGQLVWSDGVIAKVKLTDGTTETLFCDIDATFDDCTHSEPLGMANASFAVGGLALELYLDYGHTTWVGTMTASLYSGFAYNEGETQDPATLPSSLYGSAIIKLDSWNVPGYDWVEALGAPTGLTATTTGTTPLQIIDYTSDWSSSNTIVTIMADESGIPEPATVALLALGGLVLRRRKR